VPIPPRVGPEHPLSFLSSLFIHFLVFCSFYFSPFSFLIRFTYFLLSIPSLSTRVVPLRFHVGGHRRGPNLGLVFVLTLCYLYFLVKDACLFFCCIWFSLVLWCDRCLPLLQAVAYRVIIYMSLSIPFRFWVAAEQKGSQG